MVFLSGALLQSSLTIGFFRLSVLDEAGQHPLQITLLGGPVEPSLLQTPKKLDDPSFSLPRAGVQISNTPTPLIPVPGQALLISRRVLCELAVTRCSTE